MSEEKKDQSGPAFPVTERQEHLDGATVCHEWVGLSKREFYAGLALQGLVVAMADPSSKPDPTDFDYAAELCFKFADSMIREGGK